MLECKLCDNKTSALFNIGFKQVPICDECADTVVIQQVQYLVNRNENSAADAFISGANNGKNK